MVRDRNGETVDGTGAQDGFLKFLYRNACGRILLKLMASRPMTVLVGSYMNSRLSVPRARKSIRGFGVDLSELEKTEFLSYNEFFTRKKKPEFLSFDPDESHFCAPADSKLTVFPLSDGGKFTVKGVPYTVSELLGSEEDVGAFAEGYAFVFRLAVDDYHRYSYPDDGNEVSYRYLKGVFHTVNPIALEKLPVFHRNARAVTILDTAHFGRLAFVEVGAMMVGKIVNRHRDTFARGDEKGYFEFGGSTVVVLTGKDAVVPDADLLINSKEDCETVVHLGERVGVRS